MVVLADRRGVEVGRDGDELGKQRGAEGVGGRQSRAGSCNRVAISERKRAPCRPSLTR